MNFNDYLARANVFFRFLQQGKKEKVSSQDAVMAFSVLENISYETAADFYLGCAALNLLNTYVKQKPSPIGYSFKDKLYPLILAAESKKPEGVVFQYEIGEGDRYDGLSVIEVSLFGKMQFSFHCMRKTEALQHILERQRKAGTPAFSFDGVRKQMCAVTVFQNAWTAAEFRSNASKGGESLDAAVARDLKLFQLEKCWLERDGIVYSKNIA